MKRINRHYSLSFWIIISALVIAGAWWYLGSVHSATDHRSAPTNSVANPAAQFGFPLDRATTRITKKPFGIYITPKTSPIQPEKFTGYHTGTDFETFANEADGAVTIKAITAGRVIYKQWVSGYGGVLVQSAEQNGQPITILYGHLALSSITAKVGDKLIPGETIGDLGQGYSHDTDGERKHLHLGVHRGSQVVLLGYAVKASDLSGWLDVTTLW